MSECLRVTYKLQIFINVAVAGIVNLFIGVAMMTGAILYNYMLYVKYTVHLKSCTLASEESEVFGTDHME